MATQWRAEIQYFRNISRLSNDPKNNWIVTTIYYLKIQIITTFSPFMRRHYHNFAKITPDLRCLDPTLVLRLPIFAPIPIQHTLFYLAGPDEFNLCADFTSNFCTFLSFLPLSFCVLIVSGMKCGYLVSSSLYPWTCWFAAMTSASPCLFDCWALTLSSQLCPRATTNTSPAWPKTSLQPNCNVAFSYHSKHPYMSVI